MAQQTRILSYDVGMRNLSHCLVREKKWNEDNRHWSIDSWDVMDVVRKIGEDKKFSELSMEEIDVHMTRHLFETAEQTLGDISKDPIHHVAIELQPGASRQTESVAHSICVFYQTYFLMKKQQDPNIVIPTTKFHVAAKQFSILSGKLPLHFFNGGSKHSQSTKTKTVSLDDFMNREEEIDECDFVVGSTLPQRKIKTNQYSQNKSDSIYELEIVLNSCPGLKQWHKFYESVKERKTWKGEKQKTDDLADSFWQAMRMLLSGGVNSSADSLQSQTIKNSKSKKQQNKPIKGIVKTQPLKKKRQMRKKKKQIDVTEVEIKSD